VAIAFELAVNFGSDEAAAHAACELVIGAAPLTAGNQQVPLHEPLLHLVQAEDGSQYRLMTVLPVGVGWGVAIDRGRERRSLTAAQLTDLGHGLYGLLGRFRGYQVAQVGWDPEGLVDPVELRHEQVDELAAGTLPGLVLAEDILPDLRGSGFVPFRPGFVWLPYAGERPSTLTTEH